MFCSRHIDIKRHSVCFPEIEKTFAVSSLVLNLFASQIGEFFLPNPVVRTTFILALKSGGRNVTWLFYRRSWEMMDKPHDWRVPSP